MHLDNPLTSNWSAPSSWNGAGSAWDNTPFTVAAVLNRSSVTHEAYLAKLALVADFFQQLAPVPIVFRPFHEFTNTWSWWGRSACSAEEFRQLWRLTVNTLREAHGVDNLLYAWSAASSASMMSLDSHTGLPPSDNEGVWPVGTTSLYQSGLLPGLMSTNVCSCFISDSRRYR